MDLRRFGFNIFSAPVEDVLYYTVSSGLGHIEINMTSTHSGLESFNLQRVRRIREFTQKHAIGLSLHLPSKTNLADIIPPFRRSGIRYLKSAVELAAALQASHITLHMGNFYWFPVERWMRRNALKRFADSLNSVLQHLERNQVILSLENVVSIPHGSDFFFLGDNIEDFMTLFQVLPSKQLQFCLDTGHANMGEGVDAYIERFSNRLNALHFHDNNGSNDEHLPVGQGSVDWERLAELLMQCKFEGPLISECRHLKPHEAALKFLAFFQPLGSD